MRPTAGPRLLAGIAIVATSACSPDLIAPDPVAGPAAAVMSTAWVDDFDMWDASRWIAGDHALGLSVLSPANVSVSGGALLLRTPAGTRDGGEIRSVDTYASGSFSARLRCELPVGAICAFFLYEFVTGNRNDEIDIEIPAGTRRMFVTTWVRGRQTNHTALDLPFDPAAGFHEYAIDWSSGRASFLVDGVLVHTFRKRIPSRPMHVFANAWWPVWLSGSPPATDAFLTIDRISFNP
jgi:beta-glucanase (GH16 family)